MRDITKNKTNDMTAIPGYSAAKLSVEISKGYCVKEEAVKAFNNKPYYLKEDTTNGGTSRSKKTKPIIR